MKWRKVCLIAEVLTSRFVVTDILTVSLLPSIVSHTVTVGPALLTVIFGIIEIFSRPLNHPRLVGCADREGFSHFGSDGFAALRPSQPNVDLINYLITRRAGCVAGAFILNGRLAAARPHQGPAGCVVHTHTGTTTTTQPV